MAKTLKDFLEGYLKVKSADEQKFIDKHVTAKNPDRNGNGDDVFKGSTKTIDRRKERKGYNPGEDEKVYEALKGNQHKIDANKNGKVDAHDFKLLRGKKKVAEEAEELEEMDKSPEANPYSGWGHRKGDDYAGKPGNDHAGTGKLRTTKQTTKDAARVLDKVFKGRGVKEEVEELEELSKKTLGSYVIKSLAPSSEKSISNLASKGGYKLGQAHDDDYTAGEKEDAKSVKRSLGVLTAVRKMTKEQSELEEKLTAKTPMGKYIKDFTKSDAPQFKGKSQDKRRVMAIAAKLTAERGGRPLNKEERLQDRLSDISESHQRVMLEVFGKLNEDNKTKFMTACATPEGVEQMLDFAITYRGE